MSSAPVAPVALVMLTAAVVMVRVRVEGTESTVFIRLVRVKWIHLSVIVLVLSKVRSMNS